MNKLIVLSPLLDFKNKTYSCKVCKKYMSHGVTFLVPTDVECIENRNMYHITDGEENFILCVKCIINLQGGYMECSK